MQETEEQSQTSATLHSGAIIDAGNDDTALCLRNSDTGRLCETEAAIRHRDRVGQEPRLAALRSSPRDAHRIFLNRNRLSLPSRIRQIILSHIARLPPLMFERCGNRCHHLGRVLIGADQRTSLLRL